MLLIFRCYWQNDINVKTHFYWFLLSMRLTFSLVQHISANRIEDSVPTTSSQFLWQTWVSLLCFLTKGSFMSSICLSLIQNWPFVSFCRNKHLLLTPREVDELQELYGELGFQDDTVNSLYYSQVFLLILALRFWCWVKPYPQLIFLVFLHNYLLIL